MKTKQERTIESYDIHTQLYLHVDEDQNRRHQRFRYMYNVLAILAALIPRSLYFSQCKHQGWRESRADFQHGRQ
ncbi:hypothetical protein Ljor_1584 [Legionella jordanis]|uniref:Uncharacterized protein n=1 Tax=Legionella jordanis TaxID=456 RepID=A0A0W0VAX1_9GAMM|nr:hypothetical protein Ljor_1584 [Legionella jordanis]VEH12523.1 Uncharacterised protein [Legionella jordanis]